MYAVIITGGKQYRVALGDTLRVEKIDAEVGATVQIDKVSFLAKDDGIVADPGALASAKVMAEVVSQGRAKKIRVFKYKRRKNYRRTQGHRQSYTELRIREIQA